MTEEEIKLAIVELQAELRGFRELSDAKEKAYSLALSIAKSELGEHLDRLNNAHARADKLANEVIGKEVYARDHREITEKIAILANYQANMTGRMWAGNALVVLISIILGIVGLIVH